MRGDDDGYEKLGVGLLCVFGYEKLTYSPVAGVGPSPPCGLPRLWARGCDGSALAKGSPLKFETVPYVPPEGMSGIVPVAGVVPGVLWNKGSARCAVRDELELEFHCDEACVVLEAELKRADCELLQLLGSTWSVLCRDSCGGNHALEVGGLAPEALYSLVEDEEPDTLGGGVQADGPEGAALANRLAISWGVSGRGGMGPWWFRIISSQRRICSSGVGSLGVRSYSGAVL